MNQKDPLVALSEQMFFSAAASASGGEHEAGEWMERFRSLPILEREAFIFWLIQLHDESVDD